MVVLIVSNLITATALVVAILKIKKLQSDIKISQALEEQMWDDISILIDEIQEEKVNIKD
jgi:hypothetical protein